MLFCYYFVWRVNTDFPTGLFTSPAKLKPGGGHNSPNFAWLGLYVQWILSKMFPNDWVGIIEYSGFNPKYIYLYDIVWTVNFNIFQQWDIVVLKIV